MPRDQNGRFVREEEFNFNFSPFSIMRYLAILVLIFPWYKWLENSKALNMFDCECPTPQCPNQNYSCPACPSCENKTCGVCPSCNGRQVEACPTCPICPNVCPIK